jgi:hypothetical protein
MLVPIGGIWIHTHWKDEIAPLIFPHINVESTRSGNLLQLALWARGTAKVVKTTNNAQHGSQRDPTSIPS